MQSNLIPEDPRINQKLEIIRKARPECSTEEDTGYEMDERGMAELFAECYCDECRYCAEVSEWFCYKDGVWKKDYKSNYTMGKVIEFTRILTLYAYCIESDELRKKYLIFMSKVGDRRFRDRMLKDSSNNELLLISATEFDKNPYYINCKNGTYDLKTFTWHEHNPSDLLTMMTNFNYMPWVSKSCERWEQFIDEIMQGNKNKAHYLQKCLGYSIIGIANEDKFFVCYGRTTRNGKSTLLNSIHHMLGDYADVSPVSIICKSGNKNSESANPMVASLKGKRFVTMAESDQYGKLDEEQIKQLTGGEEIKARNLYEKPITFMPQFTMWLSCNYLPMVLGKTLFSSERIVVITFDKHFSQTEQDKSLKQFFETDDAMQGIFEWLIAGYKAYLKEGLEFIPEVQQAVKEYAKDNDLCLQFLEELCEVAEDGKVQAQTLYERYKKWCTDNSNYLCTRRKFYSELDAKPDWISDKKVSHGMTTYYGIRFKGGE